MPSSGSISSPASGAIARAAVSASGAGGTSPSSARRKPSTSGIRRGSTVNAPSRSTSGAAFASALSAIPGIDACPLRPYTRNMNGELIFSAVEQRYSTLPPSSTRSPAPSLTEKSARTASG